MSIRLLAWNTKIQLSRKNKKFRKVNLSNKIIMNKIMTKIKRLTYLKITIINLLKRDK